VLIPGNIVDAEINARAAGQLPWGRVELLQSRGPWLGEPLPAAAIAWVTGLTAAVLPEHHAYPALHDAAAGLLDAVCVAPSARDWVGAMVGYEQLILRELGYGGIVSRPDLSDWPGLLEALDRTGILVGRYLLADRLADVMAARDVLRQRLGRIGGQEPGRET
jgi:DNA repair protein RecO (recombination protein O)